MTVAQTIYNQLGAAKFSAMTGAKNLLSTANSLSFQFPRAAKNKIKYVKITLAGDDTYTVSFSSYNQKTYEYTIVKIVEKIHVAALKEVVESNTGLALSLK